MLQWQAIDLQPGEGEGKEGVDEHRGRIAGWQSDVFGSGVIVAILTILLNKHILNMHIFNGCTIHSLII